jgi:hypothetical protein
MLAPNQIFTLLDPYIQKIRDCMTKAVQHYQEKLSNESKDLDQRTISNYIRCQIVKNLNEEFMNDSEIKIREKRGMIVLTISTTPVILLRFKKFNSKNQIACSKTQQAMAYAGQELSLFPEYMETINLNAGYKWLDDIHNKIDCLIGFPSGLRNHSWVEIIPENSNINRAITETPTTIIKNKPKLITEEVKVDEKVG